MARTVRFATTVTPLEAEYVRRLAKRAHRTPQGWLYLILKERLLQEVADIKEKSRSVNPGSSVSMDVLPADPLRGQA